MPEQIDLEEKALKALAELNAALSALCRIRRLAETQIAEVRAEWRRLTGSEMP